MSDTRVFFSERSTHMIRYMDIEQGRAGKWIFENVLNNPCSCLQKSVLKENKVSYSQSSRRYHLLSFLLDPSTGSSAGKMYTLAGKFYAGMRGNCVQLDNSLGESSEWFLHCKHGECPAELVGSELAVAFVVSVEGQSGVNSMLQSLCGCHQIDWPLKAEAQHDCFPLEPFWRWTSLSGPQSENGRWLPTGV